MIKEELKEVPGVRNRLNHRKEPQAKECGQNLDKGLGGVRNLRNLMPDDLRWS